MADTATVLQGVSAYESATGCEVTDWEVDGNTVCIRFIPPPDETTFTVQDVTEGMRESEEWFAHNYD